MLLHWIWLSERPGINQQAKLALIERYGDPEDIYDLTDYHDCEDLSAEALESLQNKDLSEAESILEQCAKKKIHIVTWNDRNYPSLLRAIADPPVILYYKGMLPYWNDRALIGVVGTRKASAYGLHAAKHISGQLARCGGVVVTGMALGVDAMAAAGALDNGGTVVGVLGCGVDRIYPAGNRDLFYRVVDNGGCLISEYPPGTPPNHWHFPKRNRIISGIGAGVLVVEAPEKSGALITARCALEQGRDVFAVPGNLGVAGCAGSNGLLRDGAAFVTCGWDILSTYAERYRETVHSDDTLQPVEMEHFASPRVAQGTEVFSASLPKSDKKAVDNPSTSPYSGECTPPVSDEEQLVLSQLTTQPQLIDDVIACTGLPSGKALAALTMLELKGMAKSLPGRYAVRI